MHPHYSVIAVVGGGASGMIAALTASDVPGRHVLLLERQQRLGRKLLATGNGRCNLSNRDAGPADYFGTDPSFAAYALSHFRSVDTQRFFAHLGLLTTTEPDGRIYPLSDSSNSVLDVLRFGLDRAGVEQRCSFPVEEIRPDRAGYTLRSGTEKLHADAVILACGGAAGAKLGGVTDGYRLGKALGHRRSSLYPSLTRILTDPVLLRAAPEKSSLPKPESRDRRALTFPVPSPSAAMTSFCIFSCFPLTRMPFSVCSRHGRNSFPILRRQSSSPACSTTVSAALS